MRKLLAFSALLLLSGSGLQALAKDGGLAMPLDARQWRAERVNICADRKYQCLQNAVGLLTSQRGQCVIRYDQCLNR
jgi:hypothetical protein